MKSDLPTQCIGVDLLQDRFHIAKDREDGDERSLHRLLPSALLPLYPDEKGIFGFEALHHRRAKGWERPHECRMFWNNDRQNGCSRIPLAAAMQRLIRHHLAWGDRKGTLRDYFYWQPFGSKQQLSASEIIAGSLHAIDQNPSTLMALAVPDKATQGFQQSLIHAFYSRKARMKEHHAELLLLKRSIAQALCWCHQQQKNLAVGHTPLDGRHVGHLVVINGGMDHWEARLVALRWYRWSGHFYLLPVDGECSPGESLEVTGWQLAMQQLKLKGLSENALWQSLIGSELLDDLFHKHRLTSTSWRCLREVDSPLLPHTEDLCVDTVPELIDVENTLKRLLHRESELIEGGSNRLGVIIDGCGADWLMQLAILPWSIVEDRSSIAQRDHPSLGAQGAKLYAKCRAEGIPTYLEELTPIYIWCRNSHRHGEEFIWRALIAKDTILAGYKNEPQYHPGFVVPEGQSEIALILRRATQGREKGYEYRKISAKIHRKFSRAINVTIRIEIKPGGGFAKSSVVCDDGHLLAHFDWEAMSICEKPRDHSSSYLARNCEASSDEERWSEIVREIAKLDLQEIVRKKSSLHRLEEPLKMISDLFDSKSRVKADKDDLYREWRIISCRGNVAHSVDQLKLLSDFLELCLYEAEAREAKEVKKQALRVMRHLFTATSKLSRQRLLNQLDQYQTLKRADLICMGHAFEEASELEKFFTTFSQVMNLNQKEIYFWLRALRAILRYRSIAVDPEVVSDTLYLQLWTSITNKLPLFAERAKILPSALQCLIYLLGRRRFDKHFIALHSPLHSELNQILSRLKRSRLLEQLEKLLNCKAEEGDIQLLLSSEISSDDE